MNGLDHINYQCQKEAYEGNITGLYRVFLSSKDSDLISIVKNPKDIIVNLKNQTLYKSWTDVFKRSVKFWNIAAEPVIGNSDPFLLLPILYSFNGKNVLMDSHW